MIVQPAPGTVTLVGGGPGDPDLITVAGLKALQAADVILYDRLGPVSLLDDVTAELIPVGKIPHGDYVPQERINQLLVEHAQRGRRVVRLKGGDSFVFGRGGEEWQACAAAGIPCQAIPGVSSSTSAPALAGIPLTHRHLVQGFTIVSGHVGPADERSKVDWSALARTRTTLVVLMGIAHIDEIAAALMDGGLAADTAVAVVADASMESQHVVATSLGQVTAAVREAGIKPPAVVVIGECAGLDLAHTDAASRIPSDH